MEYFSFEPFIRRDKANALTEKHMVRASAHLANAKGCGGGEFSLPPAAVRCGGPGSNGYVSMCRLINPHSVRWCNTVSFYFPILGSNHQLESSVRFVAIYLCFVINN